MIYVALLRGINVGGKKRVDMKQLKAVFEESGFTSVRTYINSGNVIFSATRRSQGELAAVLEDVIEAHFGFRVKVLVRDLKNIRTVVKALPPAVDKEDVKCDVMFLWDEVARPSVLKQFQPKPEIDDVRYAGKAVIWCVDVKNVTRSGLMKIAGTVLYKKMTIRNVNTTRKLLVLMEDAPAG